MLSPSAPIANAEAERQVWSSASVSENGSRNATTTIRPTQTCLGRVLNSASSWRVGAVELGPAADRPRGVGSRERAPAHTRSHLRRAEEAVGPASSTSSIST